MSPATPSEDAVVETRFFRHPTIPRKCYTILARTPFERQQLVIYLLKYDCR